MRTIIHKKCMSIDLHVIVFHLYYDFKYVDSLNGKLFANQNFASCDNNDNNKAGSTILQVY